MWFAVVVARLRKARKLAVELGMVKSNFESFNCCDLVDTW